MPALDLINQLPNLTKGRYSLPNKTMWAKRESGKA